MRVSRWCLCERQDDDTIQLCDHHRKNPGPYPSCEICGDNGYVQRSAPDGKGGKDLYYEPCPASCPMKPDTAFCERCGRPFKKEHGITCCKPCFSLTVEPV